MRILLDSNALVWWLMRVPRLGSQATEAITDPGSEVFVSAASVWELSIKAAIGKLDIPDDLPDQMVRHQFAPLPVTIEHALRVRTLPLIHKDPFDRMLIAQAMAESLVVVTSDPVFGQYGIDVIAT